MTKKTKPEAPTMSPTLRRAEIALALETLGMPNGIIPTPSMSDVIEGMGGEPGPSRAGWIADAVARTWGSWAAFEKDRKTYDAEQDRSNAAIGKGLDLS